MQALRVSQSRLSLKQNVAHSKLSPCQLSASSLYMNQKRNKLYNLHTKMLEHPKYKKVYKHPRTMKEYMFTDDTLHSLSHGEDYKVKIRVADYPQLNKRKYRVHPNRLYCDYGVIF